MEFILEQLTGPTNPNDFVGRNQSIDAFHNVLMEFIRSNPVVRWVHISGVAGVGKSSLMRKFRMMTELERVATSSVEVPISPKKANTFLTDIKLVIDEIAPKWRGFLRSKTNFDIADVVEPPEASEVEITEQVINDLAEQFFVDLDKIDKAMKSEKVQNAIYLDDLDRFLNYNYTSILSAIPKIAERLMRENYSLLLVTTGHYRANRYLGFKENASPDYVVHLELDQFDFNEAELMIRRRGKLIKSERELVVQASTRFPFDLTLRQMIQTKSFDPTTLDAKIITDTFGLTPAEVEVLKDMAKNDYNFYNMEEYLRLHAEETLQDLSNSLMIIIEQDGYFAVDSHALWELISHVFKPIDPRTEVILILSRLKYQAELGQMPSQRDFKIVGDHFKNIKDNALLFELSGQLADAAKAALDGGLVHTAWEMLQLATLGLEPTEDYEKIADLQENLAKGFAKENHNYFAAKSFETAGEFFRKANIDWRSSTNFREAGQKYYREAEDTDAKIYHYAIRSMLKESYNAYLNANEPSRARRVLEDAQDLLRDYSQHVAYFKKLEVKGE